MRIFPVQLFLFGITLLFCDCPRGFLVEKPAMDADVSWQRNGLLEKEQLGGMGYPLFPLGSDKEMLCAFLEA